MPNRLIRATILESKKFNRLSEPAQNFFFRLMMVADDYGFYLSDPELMKSYMYPRMPQKTIDEIASHLKECFDQDDPETGKLIENHGSYLEIRNFNQRLRLKKSSKYKNDRHMSVKCQSRGAKMTTSPSTSSSSLEERKEGGVGGEKEEEQLERLKTHAELELLSEEEKEQYFSTIQAQMIESVDPKYADLKNSLKKVFKKE